MDAPLILREENAGTQEVLVDGLRQHDILPDMLNVVMTLGNVEAIEMAVEEGIGISYVSRLAAARGLGLGRVVEVEVAGMSLQRNIYLMRNRRFPQRGRKMRSGNLVRRKGSGVPHTYFER